MPKTYDIDSFFFSIFQCIFGAHCVHLAARHQDRVLFAVHPAKELQLNGLRERLMVRGLRPTRRGFALITDT